MTKVSIITLTYNSHDDTLELLDSLAGANFKGLAVSVVVVDNASKAKFQIPNHSAGSGSKTKFQNFQLEVIYSEKNTGFTGGNNLGMKTAFEKFNPDFILLLNNDTLVEKNFLQELVKASQELKHVGMICPMIYFAPGREFHRKNYTKDQRGQVIWFAGGSIDWKHVVAFHRGVDEVDRGQFDWMKLDGRHDKYKKANELTPYFSPKTMDFATGCCVLIPKKVIERVGVFDESYFLYWEDVDWSYRVQQAGYKLYFWPRSVVWHKNAGSTGGSGSQVHQKYQERNRIKFGLKYAPWKKKLSLLKLYLLN